MPGGNPNLSAQGRQLIVQNLSAKCTWQDLKDVLDEAIDLSIGSALTDGIDNDDRNRRAGYAQAMKDTMATLNRYRKI